MWERVKYKVYSYSINIVSRSIINRTQQVEYYNFCTRLKSIALSKRSDDLKNDFRYHNCRYGIFDIECFENRIETRGRAAYHSLAPQKTKISFVKKRDDRMVMTNNTQNGYDSTVWLGIGKLNSITALIL